MAITIIVTNAGRAALVNAANTGTNAVTITQLGITATAFAADPAQVALPGEIKRIASVAGVVVADDAIHVTASDVTTDAYTMRGFALYLADGTLFALYGQAGAILNKTAESMMLLAADIAFADIDATMIEFGDTNFVLPPATTEILGLVELATTAEGQAGSDNSRVLTPYVGKQSVLGWLLSQDGAGSGLDADLLDGLHASAFALAGHTHGTMANQNANAVAITGGSLANVSVGVVDGTAGAPGLFWNADTDTGLYRSGANTLCIATGGAERARVMPDGRVGIGIAAPSEALDINGNILAGNGNATTGASILTSRYSDGGVSTFGNLRGSGSLAIGFCVKPSSATTDTWLSSVSNNWARAGIKLNGSQMTVSFAGAQTTEIGTPVALSPVISVNANGNVGIGANDALIGERLTVYGAADGAPSALFRYDAGATKPYLMIRQVDAAGLSRVDVNSAAGTASLSLAIRNVDVLTIDTNRNVGIGTAAPVTKLHVLSSSEIARFESSVARGSGNCFARFRDPTGSKGYFGYAGVNDDFHVMNELAGKLGLGTSGTFRWALGQSGHFEAVADNVYDFGGPGARARSGYFGTSVQIAGNAAWHAGNDGSGSGLDADLLDGFHASYFLPAATFSAAEILSRLLTVDGPGSGLNADLLDGLQASDFLQIAAASVLQSGYIAFSNGLKIVWGRVNVSMDSYSNVTYPISFDTVPAPVFPTIDQIGTASQQNTLLASSTASGFSVYQAGDTSGSLPYHVIGK